LAGIDRRADPRPETLAKRHRDNAFGIDLVAKTIAVVQARTSSTRLPRKVLAPIGPHSMIERLLRQLSGCRRLHGVIVATSNDAADDELAAHLATVGADVFRGDLVDVLSRYAAVAERAKADAIVRLTGDCPLHTPDTIDEVVQAFFTSGADYATNTEPYTRPDGLDVEIFTAGALREANLNALPGPDREHVTPYIRRSPTVRRHYHLHSQGPRGDGLRWTVDEPADLAFVRQVWSRLDELGSGPHTYETVMSVARTIEPSNAEVQNLGYYKSLFLASPCEGAPALALGRSEKWLQRSEQVIPGGAQTYSKSWRQHIRGVAPIFLERGAGARVWDVDGNEYIDLIQGLLPNLLGYAHPEVDRAVYERSKLGHSFSLAHPLEVELAERLSRLIPCAEMVRFGKNGSDATAGAVRAARAFTKRDHVAVCGYHGWQDWFIGTTSRTAGVPKAVRELAHAFPYNDLEALDRLLSSQPGGFAAVIMEPFNFVWPADGYLDGVKQLAHKHGALLIFDEICTGFRIGLSGAQGHFGVVPDLAAFGKAMGNGYAISCVAGRRDVMQMFEDAFFSFTFAGDVGAMAAAMTVLDILEHGDGYARLAAAGRALMDGTTALAEMAGLADHIRVQGHPHWQLLRFVDADGRDDPALKTLWNQEAIRRGVLILSTHNVSAALGYAELEHVLRAYAGAFKFIGEQMRKNVDLAALLDGPIPSPAFRARG
jgi:glutamate-1-semialdehyde aminotransferase/spore coat polysaccharide biosynthesis protein SpsF (cytidylyltransferase family)